VSSSPSEGTLVAVTMPQMGVSMAEGTIAEWRKQPGDWIEADETVCEVTTDKIDVEIPSPASGRLERILAEPGDTIAVGTAIAEIDAGARPGEAHPDEHRQDRESEAPSPESGETGPQSAETPAPSAGESEAADEPDRSGFYSPVVLRIAEKHGVDLAQVEGTGVGGRVRKRDVLAYIESGNGEQATPAEKPLHTESPYEMAARSEQAASSKRQAETPPPVGDGAAAEPALGERREPLSTMRRAIAEHMVASRHTAAHCTTIVEVDLSGVVARRAELRESMRGRGVNLTYLAFVAEATVASLAEFPILNASIDGGEVVYHDDVNLGIAVALEDGLIVPVIPKAQRLSLEGLAAAIGDLAARARERRLEPDDVHGGTFTITNPGQFGAVLATPIINQPQVGILDLEAVVKRPVVIESADGDSIAIRPMTNLCMSWDHRALDGAVAARFMAALKGRLERQETNG
jgi:2-oxoglutarate dehydrogenase dihydrolipoamide succinyltransferase (E2 component)